MQGAGTIGPPTGLPLGGGRTVDAVTQSDAAAICAGLRKKHFLAGRVRWLQDWSSCAELERFLWVEAAGIAHRENWIVSVGPRIPVLRSLSELSVAELACPREYNSDAARVAWFGDQLEMDGPKIWRAWEVRFRGYYQAIYSVVELWSDVSASHIKFKQRDDDDEA